MKWFAPDYYQEFSCIAGACKHSCCAGWEIDIDPETLARYRQIPGIWGKRLNDQIVVDGETASFRLTHDERCPFLNADGLCELILHFGEESLCQICTDHPRFRSFFDSFAEIGLGLCCEEAARLILSRQEPMQMVLLEDDGIEDMSTKEEQAFLEWREEIFAIAQNRSLTLAARTEQLGKYAGLTLERLEMSEWKPFLLSIERLDEQWAEELEKLSIHTESLLAEWELPLEQLLVYLLMRHLPAALEDGDWRGHLAFVLFAWQLVYTIFAAQPVHSLEILAETARRFSCEIEYSDENVDAIMDELHRVML